MTALGWAEPLFCCSCAREIGFVSSGAPAAMLCDLCLKGDGLPLPEAPNVAIRCSGINCEATASIPRKMLGTIVYYCERCEKNMGSRLPLPIMTMEEERRLGVVRSA